MSSKLYYSVSGAIFLVVAIVHAIRLVRGWTILVSDWSMPAWFSVLGLAVGGYLAYTAISLRRTS